MEPVIFIEINGGALTRICSTVPIKYLLLDWDNLTSGPVENFDSSKSQQDNIMTEEQMKRKMNRAIKDQQAIENKRK